MNKFTQGEMNKFKLSGTIKFLLDALIIIAIISLFLLPLWHAWQGYPTQFESPHTAYSALDGVLPREDAVAYYRGANHFRERGILDEWNTRRPLNALLLAVRLWASGNFLLALIIQAVLCGVSAFLLCSTIRKSFGSLTAGITLLFIFLFAATFIPTSLSETLGLTLGCLSFVLLWEGILQNKNCLIAMGGLLLTTALNARAGAFLVLPLLVLWLTFQRNNSVFDSSIDEKNVVHNVKNIKEDETIKYREKNSRWNWRLPFCKKNCFVLNIAAPLSLLIGVIFGFIFNAALVYFYGDTAGGTSHSNFSYTIYGLVAGGKGWTYALSVFPNLKGTETEIANFLYQESWKLFLNNPFLAVLGFIKSAAGSIKHLTSFFQYELPDNLLLKGVVRGTGISLLVFGVWRLVKLYKIMPKEIGFISVGLVGMLLSAAVIWRDGGFRVFAATVPFFAVGLGIIFGFYPPHPKIPPTPLYKGGETLPQGGEGIRSYLSKESGWALEFGLLFLIAGLVFPKYSLFKNKVEDVAFVCGPNETRIVTRDIKGAPHVMLTPPGMRFRNNVARSIIEDKSALLKITETEVLTTNRAFGLITHIDGGSSYILADPELFKHSDEFIGVCATRIAEHNDNILQIKSYKVLSKR